MTSINGMTIGIPTLTNIADYYAALPGNKLAFHWPLTDSLGASSIEERINGLTGTNASAVFGEDGFVKGTSAYFNGAARVLIPASTMNTHFNRQKGGIACFVRISDAVYADSTSRIPLCIGIDVDNHILFQKNGLPTYRLYFLIRSGGVEKTYTYAVGGSAGDTWIHILQQWDLDADRWTVYADGLQIADSQASLGEWSASALDLQWCGIGNRRSTSGVAIPLIGHMQHVMGFNDWLTSTEIYKVANSPNYRVYNFMPVGDSKATDTYSYADELVTQLTTGNRIGVKRPLQIAQGGATTGDIADIIDTELATRFDIPTHVCINLGVNNYGVTADVDTVSEYRYILSAISTAMPSSRIGVVIPWKEGTDAAADNFADVLLPQILDGFSNASLAHDERDWFKSDIDNLSDDGIHPNAAGQVAAATQWLSWMTGA